MGVTVGYPLTEEEIRTALIRELKLLEAEGVETVAWPLGETVSQDTSRNDKSPPTTVHPEGIPEEICNTAKSSDPFFAGRAIPQNSDALTSSSSLPPPPIVLLPHGDKQTRWNYLREKVLHCPVCCSHVKPQKKVVFGVGNLDSDIFFCGEAPGADEEIQGEPFVGRAGQLLTKIIEAMGLSRSDVYIGNIMNWRPEMPTSVGNRPPTQEEMEFCLPYLRAQVEIVSPKVIVALGATAVHGLLGYDPTRRICSVRGTWKEFAGIPLLITYHPSYILRNGSIASKRIIWEDFMAVMERLSMPISQKQRNLFLNQPTVRY
jgi:DNA polymerase